MECPNCKKEFNAVFEDVNIEGDYQTVMHFPCGAEILVTCELVYDFTVQRIIEDKEDRENYATLIDYNE